jgi:hypothetical protein
MLAMSLTFEGAGAGPSPGGHPLSRPWPLTPPPQLATTWPPPNPACGSAALLDAFSVSCAYFSSLLPRPRWEPLAPSTPSL